MLNYPWVFLIMSRYDFVIFGATGFIGQYVVEEMANQLLDKPSYTMAVAGRDRKKLRKTLSDVGDRIG